MPSPVTVPSNELSLTTQTSSAPAKKIRSIRHTITSCTSQVAVTYGPVAWAGLSGADAVGSESPPSRVFSRW